MTAGGKKKSINTVKKLTKSMKSDFMLPRWPKPKLRKKLQIRLFIKVVSISSFSKFPNFRFRERISADINKSNCRKSQ